MKIKNEIIMRKLLFSLFISSILALTSCGSIASSETSTSQNGADNTASVSDGSTVEKDDSESIDDQTFSFTDASGEKYSLTTDIALEKGWTLKEGEKHVGTPDLDVSPLMDTKSIVDGDGNVIGQIGIQLIDEGYKLPEKPETSDLMALYNQVSLGNDFYFDVHDSYLEVRNGTTEIVGTTDVYISPAINSDTEEHDYGILAYKRGDSCYLGIILLRDAVTAEQWKDVAWHVTLA